MTMLSYGIIGSTLIGLISAIYLQFQQRQHPILRYIAWSFVGSAMLVLVFKNLLFESYLIRSTFNFFGGSLNHAIENQLEFIPMMVNNCWMFILIGLLIPLGGEKFKSFFNVVGLLIIIAMLALVVTIFCGHSITVGQFMMNILSGILGYSSYAILVKLVNLKNHLNKLQA